MNNQKYPEIEHSNFYEIYGITKKPEKLKLQVKSAACNCLLFGCVISVIVLFLTSAVTAQINQSTNNSDWTGSYYFSETAAARKRRKPQDVAPSASYDITIEERNGKLTADFSANGVQLFEAYECSVVVKGNTLEFYFQKVSLPDVENFRRFKKGDLLFRLTQTQSGKTTQYLFQPVAYKIIRLNPSKQKIPIYFEKQKT